MAQRIVKWTLDGSVLKLSKYTDDKEAALIIEAEFNIKDFVDTSERKRARSQGEVENSLRPPAPRLLQPAEASFDYFLKCFLKADLFVKLLGAVFEKLLNVLQVLKLLTVELDLKAPVVIELDFHLLTSYPPLKV